MFTEITKLVEAEIENAKAFEIYRILGKFGDRLTDNVQYELKLEAEGYSKKSQAIKNKVSKNIYTPLNN